jgi:hypothetical protein
MADECDAGFAGAGLTAPQPEIAASSERPADRGKLLGLVGERLGGPFAAGEIYPARRAVGDDMRGGETSATRERSRHLPGRGLRRIEQDRLDLWPQ